MEIKNILDFILIALAVFWVASAITKTFGPFNIFIKLRNTFELFECFTCVAFWATIFIGLVWHIEPIIIKILAIAGLALLLENISKKEY